MTQQPQENKMGVMPVNRLLLTMSLPMMISMLVQALYNVVDSVFVSYISEDALAAVGLAFPAQNLMISVAVGTGVGINALLSKSLGEKNFETANQAAVNGVFLAFCSWAVFAVLGGLFSRTFMTLQTQVDSIISYGTTYLSIVSVVCVGMMFQICFERLLQSPGKTIFTMISQATGAVINLILDPLLIFGLGPFPEMGIAGAAIATVTGYMIPALFGLIYFASAKRSLWFVRPRMSGAELGETCLNGSSEMVTNLSAGIITFLFNLTMMRFAGEDGVAAITIIQYSEFLLNALFMGFSQGISPVVSFNHGSRNHAQLKQVYKTAMIFTVAASVTVFLFAQFAGDAVVTVFARRGTMVWQLASHGFSVFAMGFLFSGLNIFSSALFTALGNGKVSAVISFVRTFGLIITSLLILPALLGVDGVWLAIPIAELGSTLLSLYYRKRYKQVYQYA